ncbi:MULTISPECIES: fatty acyl-AMP ligase [unclassified Coleofasciculus]|uniref:fatty acyl-AMP ligase n=1 Tax=unclassified Coleofasciculus TaxID=2692782 RepID=UPI0018829526|nr:MULTISPECIES: fatty acyl-AMP ligase [unclassified Coleofasciculus]MBE9128725.1 fatty acyl-AMP ligase [Coleofasciculus sp. LEGE 07081]MBE9151494.1 fatty acyl-AMP ligase [Coleofasciculus sp. LEGE 07092]
MADSFDYSTGNGYEFSTLVDLLRYRTLHQPDKRAFTFLKDGETASRDVTYKELDRLARAIATELQCQNAAGERALLLYPPGLEFITAFFGCLYAGVVAVPAYPPRPNQKMSRLQAIVEDSQARFALTLTSLLAKIERLLTQNHTPEPITWLTTDTIASDLASDWQEPSRDKNTLAFLQYTSGSTGDPKGVMISHGNLLHNSALINCCFEDTPESVGVSWLPPYHDMGLIGGVLQPLYVGAPMILMSPVDFLQKPWRWLQAISRYKATTSGGPNFAYDLCVRKITAKQKETLDLRSWEFAFTGAEPVRAETIERFVTAFEPCGFRRQAFYPCYGMAETTLFLSGGLKSAMPVIFQVKGAALEQNQVVPACGETGSRTLIGCGRTWLQEKIVIVNPDSLTRCPAGQVGEIWVSGPSVAQGYWNRPEATAYSFNVYLADTGKGPFMRTGDLGFVQDNELFVTGRLKDLIIIRGSNHYPQDIELTVEQSHPGLRAGCGAAFSVEVKGEERLVVVQEVERRYLRSLDVEEVLGNIRQALVAQHGLQLYKAILVKTGTIPKTSSGKIQRHACRAKFLERTLDILAEGGSSPRFSRKKANEMIGAIQS